MDMKCTNKLLIKHDESEIELLLCDCWETDFNSEEEVDFINEDKCKDAMKKYAEHMMKKQLEEITNLIKSVQSKNDSNGRYNACNEILDLVKKDYEQTT